MKNKEDCPAYDVLNINAIKLAKCQPKCNDIKSRRSKFPKSNKQN